MAIFEFTADSYIEAFWFVHYAATDWMAAVYRDGPDTPWRCTYRFRYYASADDPDDPNDRKSAYEMELTDARRLPQLIEMLDTLAHALATTSQGHVHKVVVQGDAEQGLRLIRDLPWIHSRVAAPEPKAVQ
jgi:hypothetical protein